MSLYVLDSDIMCLLQEGHPRVEARVAQCAQGEVTISVITVDEQLRGWFSLVRRAKKPKQIAFAYDQLARSVADLSKIRVLSFSESAIERFTGFQRAKLGVKANDLRIAAIALQHQATVVTRNLHDFKCIPGLCVEDWSTN